MENQSTFEQEFERTDKDCIALVRDHHVLRDDELTLSFHAAGQKTEVT